MTSTTAAAQMRDLLATYERALNSSDANLAASVYAPDGVFMPTGLPTATGDGLQAMYAGIFENITLDVSFTIDELTVTSPTTAYALTRSHGIQTVLASGDQSEESNREVFLLDRADVGWKVARYMFNKDQ